MISPTSSRCVASFAPSAARRAMSFAATTASRSSIAAWTERRGARSFPSSPRRPGARRAPRPMSSASRPADPVSLFFTVECHGAQSPKRVGFFKGLKAANRERKAGAATTIETSNEVLNEALRRATADLHMLTTRTPEGPYPYAGTPWFSTTFGRDGLITALQMLWLRSLGRQGRAVAPCRLSRRPRRMTSRTLSRARSCTRCAAAKWPR